MWIPTENTAPAIATPRSFHVVESAPDATRMYDENVMALLAETSMLRVREVLELAVIRS